MSDDEKTTNEKSIDHPDMQIKAANRELADLHRFRLLTEISKCLPAYTSWEPSFTSAFRSPSLDARLLKLLSNENNAEDFAESEDADSLVDSAESFSRQLRLYRKALRDDYDVFLCHNFVDKREVKTVGRQLRRYGLLPWLDEEEIRPGERWVSRLQEDIDKVKTCAVVIGQQGVGPWQEQELNTAIQLFVERSLPVIPIILPTCTSIPELPSFLRSFHRVDYRSLDPDPIEQLVWAITGRPPTI